MLDTIQLRRKLSWAARSNGGNAMVEFALSLPVIVTLLLGVLSGSLALDRWFMVLQIARTGGSMYARGVDWLVTENVNVLLRTAGSIDFTSTGDGVIYFSRITQAAPDTVNDGNLVVSERFAFGNSAVEASRVAAPDPSIWPDPTNANPTGDVMDYDNQPSAAATLPANLSTIALGESLYVIEVYWAPADGSNFLGNFLPFPGQYGTRLVF